jgi:foldase protein PrsA
MKPTMLFVLAAVLLSSCGQKSAPVLGAKPKIGGPVLAKVGEEALTRDELLILFRGQIPPDAPRDKLQAVLESWVNGELWYQEAMRQNIGQDETTQIALLNEERNLIARMLLSRIQDTVTVTDAEVYDYYVKHKGDYTVSTSIMYVMLYDSLLAERVVQRLKQGGDFAAVAREFSADQVTLGEPTPYFLRNDTNIPLLRLSPELNETIFELEKGQTSGLVKASVAGRATFWIVKCMDRKQVKSDVKFDSVRGLIGEELLPWKQQQAIEHISGQLKKKTKVEITVDQFYGPAKR